VRRFDGFVAKYMGDGVLVYFGYPQAHEDDAERAVRAGLELIAAVSALKAPVSLQTRVGIATGLVVVGDLIGSGEAQERGIVGETPNLAARQQGIAEPNTVVIAEGTRRLLGNLFELEDLAPKDLKGIAGPAHAWAALRPASVESRFDALHASGLTELVGREEELDLLLRRWSKAKTGEGQVVLLSGEAGIGKSRLTAALLEKLTSEPHTRLRYFCSPQHTDSAFYPIISQMERAAGFVHDDIPQARLDKLDMMLAHRGRSASGHDWPPTRFHRDATMGFVRRCSGSARLTTSGLASGSLTSPREDARRCFSAEAHRPIGRVCHHGRGSRRHARHGGRANGEPVSAIDHAAHGMMSTCRPGR